MSFNNIFKRYAANMVEIIHCKNCKWFYPPEEDKHFRLCRCHNPIIGGFIPEEDFYCGFGEKKIES